jgi:hypothetical protein
MKSWLQPVFLSARVFGFVPVVLTLVLTLGTVGCGGAPQRTKSATAPTSPSWLVDRLYFGSAMAAGGEVSEADWKMFLREVVTPRFPDGLTTWRANGQWRSNNVIVSEGSFVLELAHPSSPETERAVQEIRAEYKRRFKQESVMQVTEHATVRF